LPVDNDYDNSISIHLWCEQKINVLQAKHLYRSRRIINEPHNIHRNFSTNDYLAFAYQSNQQHRAAEITQAYQRYSWGSGASALVSGYQAIHQHLEIEIAKFMQFPAALYLGSGFSANHGVLTTLINKNDSVLSDRLNHASLIDGIQHSGARMYRYRHLDCADLAETLAKAAQVNQAKQTPGRLWIVTDGVFSMDGDWAPLQKIAQLAKQYNAALMVDDAHGFGVIGQAGQGIIHACGLTTADIDLLVVTCGKAMGTYGAFVLSQAATIDYLVQKMRHYVYSTAMPPVIAAITLASLRSIQDSKQQREHLKSLSLQLRANLHRLADEFNLLDQQVWLNGNVNEWHPVQAFILGDNQLMLTIAENLRSQGFQIGAIRPPTVPEGTARLRLSLTAKHQLTDIESLTNALQISLKAHIS